MTESDQRDRADHAEAAAAEPDLSLLGLSSTDVAAYRRLLASGPVAADPERGPWERLVEAGLVSVRDGRATALSPWPPLRAETLRRQRSVDALRHAAEALGAEYRQRPGAGAESLQVLVGAEEVTRAAVRLAGDAVAVIRGFDRGPYFAPGPLPGQAQPASARRGVRWRVVYESRSLQGTDGGREDLAGPGEEARVLPRLPFKMLVADESAALVALPAEDGPPEALSETGEGLLVRGSLLLGALIRLFEQQWDQAAPVAAPGQGPEHEDRRLLTLLAAGLTDEALARQLGVSTRTVQRRLAELSRRAGAESRFQLGAEAVRRGWV